MQQRQSLPRKEALFIYRCQESYQDTCPYIQRHQYQNLRNYLAKRGIPFRDAYKVTGGLVAYCIENGKTLNSLSLEEYKMFSPVFENDVYHALDLATCVEDRKSAGGPAPVRVREQIESLRKFNKE